jgi:hypothetical protein
MPPCLFIRKYYNVNYYQYSPLQLVFLKLYSITFYVTLLLSL